MLQKISEVESGFRRASSGKSTSFWDYFPKFRSRVTSVVDAEYSGNPLTDESLILAFFLCTVLNIDLLANELILCFLNIFRRSFRP
jgi:hypothetical protein